jgi:hypothetical protein
MPQIREFTSNVSTFRPSETGIEATAQSARRIGALGSAAASEIAETGRAIGSGIQAAGDAAVDYFQSNDVNKLSVAGTQTALSVDQAWKGVLQGHGNPGDPDYQPPADPNDPTVAAKFRENVLEPAIEKLSDIPVTEGGQKYAMRLANSLRSHFFEATTADMATRAGSAAIINDQRMVSNLSNWVTSSPDSATIDQALAQHQAYFDNLRSRTSGLTAAQLSTMDEHFEESQREIVHSAILSAITKSSDPEKTVADLTKRYSPFVDGAAEIQAARAAKSAVKINASLDRSAELQRKQLAVQDLNGKIDDIITRNIKPDGSVGASTPQDFIDLRNLATHPGASFEPGRIMETYKFLEQRAKGENDVTDPQIYKSLSDGVIDGSTDVMALIKARNDGKLSDKAFSTLVNSVKLLKEAPLQGNAFKNAMAAAKTELEMPIMGGATGRDPKGAMAYSDFANHFLTDYQTAYRRGTLQPNALDFGDPNSMISKALQPYKRTTAQKLNDWISENAADYLTKPLARAAAVRTNNPGAQWPNDIAARYGATGYEQLSDGNKIARFPTPMHGAAANMALIDRSYVGMTIADAEKKWSGGHRSGLAGFDGSRVITKAMTHDPSFMIPFMKATANAEAPHGAVALSDSQWASAFKMYRVGQEAPSDARLAQDGNYYVERGGKYMRVDVRD